MIKCYVCHDPLLKFDMVCMNEYESLCHARCYPRPVDLADEHDTFQSIITKYPHFDLSKAKDVPDISIKAILWRIERK